MTGSSLAYIVGHRRLEAAEERPALPPGQSACDPTLGSHAPDTDPIAELRFGRFRLLPGARILLRDGAPVPMGSRAFDMLHVLAAARGSVVARDDLVSRVWPTTVVEESNLRYQIGVLRKALGPDRDLVKTVAGRGYLLAAHPDRDDHVGPTTARFEPAPQGEPQHVLSLIRSVARPSEGSRDGHAGWRLRLAPEGRAALRLLLRALLDELSEMNAEAAGDVSQPNRAVARM
jgi:DNA-binding winged helix-turn-helix (wHTH) protein